MVCSGVMCMEYGPTREAKVGKRKGLRTKEVLVSKFLIAIFSGEERYENGTPQMTKRGS